MFERALAAESQVKDHHRGRSLGSFVSALAGHAVVIGAVLLASALALETIKDPEADFTFSFLVPEPPEIAPPEQRAEARRPAPEPEPRPEPEPVELPEPVQPPQPVVERVELRHAQEAPEPVEIGGTTQKATPGPDLNAGGSQVDLAAAAPAPEVDIPGGGRAGGAGGPQPGLQVGDGGSSIVAYKSDSPAHYGDITVPPPGSGVGRPGGKRGGGPVGLLQASGTGSGTGSAGGIQYGGPGDGPPGDAPGFGGGGGGRGNGRGTGVGNGFGPGVGNVRARLANKYGLPLVSVNDLGSRSTDAARWNMILPRLSDLLRVAIGHNVAGGGGGNVASVEQDGSTLIVRYRDGIVHVLVPTADGLAALYVARAAGARPVVSKVQEGESAVAALVHLTRGAS